MLFHGKLRVHLRASLRTHYALISPAFLLPIARPLFGRRTGRWPINHILIVAIGRLFHLWIVVSIITRLHHAFGPRVKTFIAVLKYGLVESTALVLKIPFCVSVRFVGLWLMATVVALKVHVVVCLAHSVFHERVIVVDVNMLFDALHLFYVVHLVIHYGVVLCFVRVCFDEFVDVLLVILVIPSLVKLQVRLPKLIALLIIRVRRVVDPLSPIRHSTNL